MGRLRAPQEVVALRYDQAEVADTLARWCGGTVHDADDPGTAAWVAVPTLQGSRRAVLGDWLVRRNEGDFYVCDHLRFAALHEPVDAGLPTGA